jgi:lipopolysaccharide O-acetyltransferase
MPAPSKFAELRSVRSPLVRTSWFYHQTVSGPRRQIGRLSLGTYKFTRRAWSKTFSLLITGAFYSFGEKSVIQSPVRIVGEDLIAIGADVFIGAGSWLEVVDQPRTSEGPVLSIGDGTSIAGTCVLSAACSIRLGRRVLLARNVYIADHSHAFEDPRRAVLDQGITRKEAVEVCDGAWLGENVFVGPGVRIGVGSVVGANAVVLNDVPDHAVAVGVPARVVRVLPEHGAPV